MKRMIVGLTLAATLAAPAASQQLVPVGARVRVRLDEPRRQAETRFAAKTLVIRGEVTAETADSIWIRPTRVTGSVGISKAGIRSMGRSRGEPRRLTSLFVEGIGGAIIGAIEGAIFYRAFGSDHGFLGADSRGESAANGAMYGAAVFGAIGFVFPVEYWRYVRLD